MPGGPIRNGLFKGPTGDYATDLANGFIQTTSSTSPGGAPTNIVAGSVTVVGPSSPNTPNAAQGGLSTTGVLLFGPGGNKDNPRLPFQGTSVIDSATLVATPLSDKVGYALNTKFQGSFAAEAGWGQVDPTDLFGVDIFVTTGNAAGDISSITDLWAAIVEPHVYSPSTALNNLYGLQTQADYGGGSAGTITNIFGLRALKVGKNGASTIVATNLYNVYIETTPTDGTTLNWAFYDVGNAYIGQEAKLVQNVNLHKATGNADTPLFVVGNLNNIFLDITGSYATERPYLFVHPTISGPGGAATVTTAATVTIDGAPGVQSGAVITNAYALWVQAGKTELDGGAVILGTTPNVQNSPAGTYIGSATQEMSDGTNVFRWDISAAHFRLLKAGVVQLLDIDLSGNTKVFGTLNIANRPGFVASDKYLVVDSGGNVHVSALGPAS